MLYRIRGDTGIAKHCLAIRLGIYVTEVIIVHFLFTLVWPYHGMKLSDYAPVKIYYFCWLARFYFSAL